MDKCISDFVTCLLMWLDYYDKHIVLNILVIWLNISKNQSLIFLISVWR